MMRGWHTVRARARRGCGTVAAARSGRRHGFYAGSPDDLDHGVRARACGQDGPPQRRETRRPRRGDGDDRRRRARSRCFERRRGRRCSRRSFRGKGDAGRPLPNSAAAQCLGARRSAITPSAAMDVSDGLAGDLAKLCAASGRHPLSSTRLSIPLSAAAAGAAGAAAASASRPSLPAATITRSCARSRRIASRRSRKPPTLAGVAVTSIGAVVAGVSGPKFLDAQGSEIGLKRLSYSHF